MDELREFTLPARPHPPWWAGALVLAGVIVLGWLIITDLPAGVPAPATTREIGPGDSTLSMTVPAIRAAPPVRHRARTVAVVTPPASPMAAPVASLAGATPSPAAVDSPPRGSAPVLAPAYGDGRLWVSPLVATPRQIASALTGKSPQELADSSVTAMVQTYLDAMAREQAANRPPKWTTTIGGKTVGLDSRWIYLGPIRIPTMLLALLPIRLQGNPTEAEFNARLQVMRADLFEAARRAQTYDDFKAAVKDERAQVEQARQFRQNQRTRPDTSHHG